MMRLLIIIGAFFVGYSIQYQYHFVNNRINWTEAQSHCRETYTDLATVCSEEDMNRLTSAFPNDFKRAAWIGLQRGVVWRWQWSFSDKEFYIGGDLYFRNWRNGHPNSALMEDRCAVLEPNGKWFDDSCNTQRHFVCFNESAMGDMKYVLIEENRSWRNAQRICRERHTDLVSVRNAAENQAIKAVASSQVWIGLFSDPWVWSDLAISSFRFWGQSQPNNVNNTQDCVIIKPTNLWNDIKCNVRRSFFCYSEVDEEATQSVTSDPQTTATYSIDSADQITTPTYSHLHNQTTAITDTHNPTHNTDSTTTTSHPVFTQYDYTGQTQYSATVPVPPQTTAITDTHPTNPPDVATNTSSTPSTNTGSTPSTNTGSTSSTNTGSTSATNTGSTSATDTGSTSATNIGSTSSTNTGSTSTTNTGSTSSTSTSIPSSTYTVSTSATDIGSTSSTNTGSTSATNTGSTSSTNTGSTSDKNTGSTSSTNTGSTSATNTGSTSATNTGSASSTNTGSTSATNTGSTPSTNTGTTTASRHSTELILTTSNTKPATNTTHPTDPNTTTDYTHTQYPIRAATNTTHNTDSTTTTSHPVFTQYDYTGQTQYSATVHVPPQTTITNITDTHPRNPLDVATNTSSTSSTSTTTASRHSTEIISTTGNTDTTHNTKPATSITHPVDPNTTHNTDSTTTTSHPVFTQYDYTGQSQYSATVHVPPQTITGNIENATHGTSDQVTTSHTTQMMTSEEEITAHTTAHQLTSNDQAPTSSLFEDTLILIWENMSWIEALTYCKTHHLDLVSVTDVQMQHAVAKKAANASTSSVWLGLRYTCKFSFWFWINSDSMCYQNWAPGHGPGGQRECGLSGAVESSRGNQWVSLHQTKKLNFICRLSGNV